jgi:hypothetical protein
MPAMNNYEMPDFQIDSAENMIQILSQRGAVIETNEANDFSPDRNENRFNIEMHWVQFASV